MCTTTTAILSETGSCIHAIEKDASLREETNFNERADVIEFIDFHIIDRIAGLRYQMAGGQERATGSPDQEAMLQTGDGEGELDIMTRRAEEVKKGLERVNEGMFVRLRERVANGLYTRSAFRQMVQQYLGGEPPRTIGYDNLDIFINGLLSDKAIPPLTIELGPEMVFYQKTPARIIFEMIGVARVGEMDVFFDIGSGLGQVAILVHLISGATAWGVEREPAYCAYAKAAASRLNLPAVRFLNMDAREADYSRGTIFFLYTPFEGGILREMLEILRKEAAKREIRIFTYGPCSSKVAGTHWLRCVNGNGEDPHKLYEFDSLAAEL